MALRFSRFHCAGSRATAPAPVLLLAVLLSGCASPDGLAPGQQSHLVSLEHQAPAAAEPHPLGETAEADLRRAQRSFARAAYGLAEKQFRAAIERSRDNPEAWLGLAASYDRLARYDLADRAYAELSRLDIDRAVLLNNHGFSHMLRGDYPRARKLLHSAQALAPADERIARNVALLEARTKKITTGTTTK